MPGEDVAGAIPAASSEMPNPESIEVPLLVEAIFRRWGYDFRDYAPSSLTRRIRRFVGMERLPSISALQERVLRDEACMRRLLDQVTVSVTSMFRDPSFFKAFREVAIPQLRQQQHPLRIWHAGCASGEEVYSVAILLLEAGLLDRTRIYATDLSRKGLEEAKAGIYPLAKVKEFTANYQASGGEAAFSAYYRAGHGSAVMRSDLSKNVVWAQHNLVTDASFNEFDLIMCRNVMIYFNAHLQQRVHRLLYDSLAPGGLLVLGRQESMQLTPHEACFEALSRREKIYRRVC